MRYWDGDCSCQTVGQIDIGVCHTVDHVEY
jgi:hypothetical protein